MERTIRISKNIREMAQELAEDLISCVETSSREGKRTSVALSGGSTPSQFFSVLGNLHNSYTQWKETDFFWSDERCVPPHSSDSNYRQAYDTFLEIAGVPPENIHRIRGEDDPEQEAERYSSEIMKHVSMRLGVPNFDIIYLGLGEDGHTASIFPGNLELFNSSRLCDVAVHPSSGQRRITLTGPVINNASRVIFMISGRNKAEIAAAILEDTGNCIYPASLVKPAAGKLVWHLDLEAASLLSQFA